MFILYRALLRVNLFACAKQSINVKDTLFSFPQIDVVTQIYEMFLISAIYTGLWLKWRNREKTLNLKNSKDKYDGHGENSYHLTISNHEISFRWYVTLSSNISVNENWDLLCCIFKGISEEIISSIFSSCEMQMGDWNITVTTIRAYSETFSAPTGMIFKLLFWF